MQVDKSCRRIRKKTAKILQLRELCGDLIPCSRGKCSFQEEYQKIQASQPIVWKFQGTERIGDSAMELIHVNIDRPNGISGTDILFAASANGSLSFYVVGKIRQQFDYGIRCMPDRVWPLSIEEQERITSLGSEASGGSVYTLNLSEPLDYDLSSVMLRRRIYKAASFDCTVWTADCNSDGSQAVVGKFFTTSFVWLFTIMLRLYSLHLSSIGTNLGAALVNLETGVPSWVFRCKSDVLSLQLDHPGKIVLCGLRNGAIVTVDTREKSEGLSARLARHQIPYTSQGTCKPLSATPQHLTKRCFELRGNISQSHITSMPSSISCLASLQLYDQCFLASSMDGSSGMVEKDSSASQTGWVIGMDKISLYDHRLMQRGPVQFYEGNVNSHTRIQLGVDPYERFFMSGGEDCNLRLWGIKSGELLCEDKFMSSVPAVVCWPGGTTAAGLHLFFSFPSPTILSSTFQQNFQECKIKAKTTETMCMARSMVQELGLDPKKGYFMCAGHDF
ncbi:hypothetical protein RHMOL_Rhmol13G0176100 [Rhododendron molle]|uniref:Uncharacterized protein n=1 Tax=Rhododendron molle TaxID=49168 RepID=A0ACC0L9G8_RHOML|nr:hypothetical protein RHMOL_Rhmol13G0176100 [Rhododendron molle]